MEFAVKSTSSSAVEVELAGWLENAVCKFSGVTGTRHNRVVRDGGILRVESSVTSHEGSEPATWADIRFADFEEDTYGSWTTEGTAFGSLPVKLSEITIPWLYVPPARVANFSIPTATLFWGIEIPSAIKSYNDG